MRASRTSVVLRASGARRLLYVHVVVDLVALWRSDGFQRRISACIDPVLKDRGEARVGPVEEFRVRFWSGVFRIPLRSGAAWFKVANPGQSFEGELLAALSRVAPGRVIQPWAVEPLEGWTLLPDGSPTLDWESEDDWLGLISDVALLQRHCQGHAAELAILPSYEAVGAADRAEHLLAELARLPSQHAQHLDPDEARRCLRALPGSAGSASNLGRSRISVDAAAQRRSTRQRRTSRHARRAPPALRLRRRGLVSPLGCAAASGRGIARVGLADPWPPEAPNQRLVDAYAEHWPEISRSDRPAVLRAADRLGALHRAE